MNTVYIVIPAYQEARKIVQVIQGIVKNGYRNIIVVDDGSTDATRQQAVSAGALVFRHPINRGKGAATRTGIEAALSLGAEIIVTIDGDGQHNPDEIATLVNPIAQDVCDVTLGTRQLKTGAMPWYKVMHNHVANHITLLYAGISVQDSQSGFRAYSKRACELLDTKTDSYEYESEIIRLVAFHKLRFREVPITVAYTKYSKSKLHKQDISNGLKTVYKMIWNALS